MLASLCSLFLLVCILAAHPVAEIGMNDDFSYFKSAQILASTGHIVYNGWTAAILGWQLYLGALFIKLFGSSFTTVRASTTLVSIVSVFLVQRTYVRVGINDWNAVIGTLSLIACPVFLPLSASFMSDIDGFFCIVVCFYACLRAVQSQTTRATLGWLIFAAATNAVGGTVRQIAWIGVLFLFPCTLWLLRRRRFVLPVGAILYLASILFIFASLRWFEHQPYSLPEGMRSVHITYRTLHHAFSQLLRALLTSVLFLLPILVAFTPSLRPSGRRARVSLVLGVLVLGVMALGIVRVPNPDNFLAPFSVNYFTVYGVFGSYLLGTRPILLGLGVQYVLTAATFIALLAFVLWISQEHRASKQIVQDAPSISWRVFVVLAGSLAFSYTALLARFCLIAEYSLYDRYFIVLLYLGIMICVRLFQARAGPNLPVASLVLVLAFAAYSTAATHDLFSMYRARLGAIQELESSGVPATSIDGSFDFNGMTQIEAVGYINDPRIRFPAVVYKPTKLTIPAECHTLFLDRTPVVQPRYSLSYDANICGGLSQFPAVTYRNWLGPRTVNIYIVKTETSANAE